MLLRLSTAARTDSDVELHSGWKRVVSFALLFTLTPEEESAVFIG